MKKLILTILITLPLLSFGQSDTIPNPSFEIVIWNDGNKGIPVKIKGEIYKNDLPKKITVVAIGEKNFCNSIPSECTYRVSKLKIILTDRLGRIKKQLEGESGFVNYFNEIIKFSDYHDKIKFICVEVERRDKLGKWHKIELNKEIILTVK